MTGCRGMYFPCSKTYSIEMCARPISAVVRGVRTKCECRAGRSEFGFHRGVHAVGAACNRWAFRALLTLVEGTTHRSALNRGFAACTDPTSGVFRCTRCIFSSLVPRDVVLRTSG